MLQGVERANLYEKLYFGHKTVEDEEFELSEFPAALATQRFERLYRLGTRRLWEGNTQQAIDHFTAAWNLADDSTEVEEADWERSTFQLGLAYLRLGENENCVNCNNGQSCLLPIREEGIHVQQKGSRQAIKWFSLLLKRNPNHANAKWLLNLAYMTLGEFPTNVPAELLIEPSQFSTAELETPSGPDAVVARTAEFPRFNNVAASSGLNTLSLSGGCILDDFDGDRDFDLVVSSWDAAGQIRYFRNDDGQFVDATQQANLTGLFGGLNLVHADYDNDGDLDIYVIRGAWMRDVGRIPNSLLQNDGLGIFTDVTFDCGMGESHHPSQTAAWLDFDNDGHLDLFVGNEHDPCQLFKNDGNGMFTDVADQAGVLNNRFTKGVTCGDFNGDGLTDIYVSNMTDANRLYKNGRDGRFTDVAEQLKVDGPQTSFATWFWDYNQDGALDLFVASYSDGPNYVEHGILEQKQTVEHDGFFAGDGKGGFVDRGAEQNLVTTQTMGSNFGDLDNDGFPDFYLGTGYPNFEGLIPNLMYHNLRGTGFEDVTTAGGFGHLQKGHGIAFADIDQDGDQDIFEQMGGAFPGDRAADCLYQNPGFGNNWLKLKLVGTQSNRSAIGSRIKADIVDDGESRSVYKWVNSGGSFGANPLRQELGMGQAKQIDRLEIFWPTTGKTQVFLDVPVNQLIEIVESESTFSVKALRPQPLATADKSP